MEIPKAIEILTDLLRDQPTWPPDDRRVAVRLGIEALKRVGWLRSVNSQIGASKLPGETPFIDTHRSLHAIKRILESPLVRPDGD